MIVSLNEIESLVLKACRGAGMSWGLAEEAAQAARWMAVREIAWDRSLASLLSQHKEAAPPIRDGQNIVSSHPGSPLCPVHAGTAIADLMDIGEAWTLNEVLHPVWLVPLVHRAVTRGSQASLTTPEASLSLNGCGVGEAMREFSRVDRISSILIELHRQASSSVETLAPALTPTVVDDASWNRLESFAARTYVPASIQSRISGAGAGVSDND